MTPVNIALTGAPQTGKSELQPAMRELDNVVCVNLNNVGNELRSVEGRSRNAVYGRLNPDSLYDDGRRTAHFYMQLLETPGLIDDILAVEIPATREVVERLLQDDTGDKHRIIIWEYWGDLLDDTSPDHVIHMDCTDREAWYRKLNARIAKREYSGDPIPGAKLDALLKAAKMHPDELLRTVKSKVDSPQLTIIDSSPEDWNEATLLRTIRSLTV